MDLAGEPSFLRRGDTCVARPPGSRPAVPLAVGARPASPAPFAIRRPDDGACKPRRPRTGDAGVAPTKPPPPPLHTPRSSHPASRATRASPLHDLPDRRPEIDL